MIDEIDRLLVASAGTSASLQFRVDGEWTSEEMSQARSPSRPTPMTPVASVQPTPISAPLAPVRVALRNVSKLRVPLLLTMLCASAGAAVVLVPGEADTALAARSAAVVDRKEQAAPPPVEDPARVSALLRSSEDNVFQAAFANLAKVPADGAKIVDAVVVEYAEELGSSSRETRARALGRLLWMAKAGSGSAAQHVAAFEKTYDASKAGLRKIGVVAARRRPAASASGRLDRKRRASRRAWRPAGHARRGVRVRPRSRAQAGPGARSGDVSQGDGAVRGRGRVLAAHPADRRARLTAMLNRIVEQKDVAAAVRLVPALRSNADAGAAGMQYYLGLFNECVAQPANLDAAREWYGKAVVDPEWKGTVERKAKLLGKWCRFPRAPSAAADR
jgi:hypothetical protein